MQEHHLIKYMLLSLLLLLNIGETTAAPPQINTLSEAINQAGRQRMLTQRIVKAYAQELLDVQPVEARRQRESAIALYERQLQALKSYAPNSTVKNSLQQADKLWQEFRAAASGEVSRERMVKLPTLSDQVLHASHQIVLHLTALSSNSVGHLVNIAGRQRMLSQRIAKFYMLRSSGLNTDRIRQAQDQAVQEFTTALNELGAAPENTSAIRQALQEIHRQWRIFEAGFRLNEGDFIPLLIAISSEKVLKGMNDITGMYAQLNSGDV